ncbi:uncharacterized protein LOC126908042 isoform X2 [Daktulosphaira vitifoliae]|uniref:uncharacterized protein LOC126908042 isoform X2 n=1 Tax=Daktulosphaira vitifoliae TaxID=58002 RepID=UPI0021AA8873|nr:uncharacterized protein LOC126908042 isoform X2 [Daktulosphaira vitifoliae]
MIFSCKCLNIQIETKGETVKFDKCNFDDSYNTHFFNKKLLCHEALAVIKRQDCLIHEEKVNRWITYECLNCNMLCYAEPIDRKTSSILISPDLLTDEKHLEDLKNSVCFSPTYKIFINWTDDSNQIYSPRSSALMPPKIKVLQRQMSEKIEEETKIVEEKIRKFTENQYSTLDEFRTKAQNDFHSLAKIILDKDQLPNFNNLPTRTTTNKLLSPVQTIPKPVITTVKNNPIMNLMDYTFKPYNKGDGNGMALKTSLIKIPLVGGSNDSGLPPASYDAEGLFPLEDMDNSQTVCVSDDDISESEESGSHDEGIYIPHLKQLEVASSLPVNVPKFMIHSGSVPHDANLHIPIARKTENKTDIAASIKALAKSVHGDRIFGELPRPRLGSQI